MQEPVLSTDKFWSRHPHWESRWQVPSQVPKAQGVSFLLTIFSVFTSHVIKIKIVTIQWKKSRVWDTIDDWYINNLAKSQLPAVFHSRVICRSVSPKFIELCMETPCLCPSEGHKHGGRNVTETSVTEFCYWNAKLLLQSSDTLK